MGRSEQKINVFSLRCRPSETSVTIAQYLLRLCRNSWQINYRYIFCCTSLSKRAAMHALNERRKKQSHAEKRDDGVVTNGDTTVHWSIPSARDCLSSAEQQHLIWSARRRRAPWHIRRLNDARLRASRTEMNMKIDIAHQHSTSHRRNSNNYGLYVFDYTRTELKCPNRKL